MAGLIRGSCLPGLRPFLMPRAGVNELAAIRSRFFTTSLRLRASQPTIKATGAKTPTKASPSAPAVAPSRYAFIKTLATKPTATILYDGPSHFWFYFGCWSSGITLLAWTALTAPTVIQQPEGTPQWISVVFGATYVLLGSMGLYLITKTPNIVGSIRILPMVPSAKIALARVATTAPAALLSLEMEVIVKRMLPFMSPKTLTTNLENVTLKSRFSLPDEYVPGLRRQEFKRAEEASRKALREFDMNHLMTMPFRRVGRAFGSMFNGIKSAWTDMGYGIIEIDGKRYKVDVTRGFAHDGFRTLERLVQIKP